MKTPFIFAAILSTALNATVANAEWKPATDSWQSVATANITQSFGESTFDQLIWFDENSLWVLRPDLGTRQDIVAWTVCKVVNKSGRPAKEVVNITFYDTIAFQKGEFKDHGSAICKG